MNKNNEIEQLTYLISKLPGLGQRSARRIVLHLLQDSEARIRSLIDALSLVHQNITSCYICGNITNSSPCDICSDHSRSKNIIAIVESVADLWAIERSNIFKGHYHILGGTLSAVRGISPELLKLPELLRRCHENEVEEVIIATNATIEGQTTAFFITEYLKGLNIHISRIASGVPIGGELDYLDDGTLSAAFSLRQPFND